MNPIKKEDIKQEVFDLYDDYAHNRTNRRDFMQKLSLYAVGGLTVPSLMSFLIEDVPKIHAPLLLQYAGLDTHINPGWTSI